MKRSVGANFYMVVISGVLACAQWQVHAQEKPFEPYSQSIPNTDLAIDLVFIPEGKFMFGSGVGENGGKADEGPPAPVKVSPFWMGKFEIPWDIYELYIFESGDMTAAVESPSVDVDAVTRPTPPYLDMTFGMGKEGHPAVGMTQYNAIQFCKWLYTRTGIFYRLPTEAEWEYACRAGSTDPYFFGKDTVQLADYAWYKSNSANKTHPIGTKKPNPWGLYDIYGNVAEWTIDQYVADVHQTLQAKGAVVENPVVKPTALYPHVVRGGSFEDPPENLRSANRQKSDPNWKAMDPQTPKSNWWFPSVPFIGLRIVRPVSAPSADEIAAYYNVKPIPDY